MWRLFLILFFADLCSFVNGQLVFHSKQNIESTWKIDEAKMADLEIIDEDVEIRFDEKMTSAVFDGENYDSLSIKLSERSEKYVIFNAYSKSGENYAIIVDFQMNEIKLYTDVIKDMNCKFLFRFAIKEKLLANSFE